MKIKSPFRPRISVDTGKGPANVDQPLDEQIGSMVKGKDVLLKPNMVDPGMPDACSDPVTLQRVIRALKDHGASMIYVADLPATYYIDMMTRMGGDFDSKLNASYKLLGYDTLEDKRVKLANLNTLPRTSFTARQIDPLLEPLQSQSTRNCAGWDKDLGEVLDGMFNRQTSQSQDPGVKTITVPVFDTTGYVVVNVAMPKHHGQYSYSGACKNLMGLVPAEGRMMNFHYDFVLAVRLQPRFSGLTQSQYNQVVNEAVRSFSIRYLKGHSDDVGMARVVKQFQDGNLDLMSLGVYMEHVINGNAIVELVHHVEKTSPCLHVMDGQHLLVGQEHLGRPYPTDFAAVSKHAGRVDDYTMKKIGADIRDVPYMQPLVRDVKKSIVGSTLPTRNLLRKTTQTDPRFGVQFYAVR